MTQLPVCRIQKFNMKCEIERMEIIYTFYFFAFLKKVIKKLLTFCYWSSSSEIIKNRIILMFLMKWNTI